MIVPRLTHLVMLAALVASSAAAAADPPYRAQLLASFSNTVTAPNSASPSVPVIAGDGRLYGTTVYGGAHGTGTIYRVESTGGLTTLYNFTALDTSSSAGTNADGAYPLGPLVQGKDGALYGTANLGGLNAGGTVFRISTGGQFSTLHNFSHFDFTSTGNDEGAWPAGTLAVGADGTLYGTASRGGAPNGGTVFKLAPDGSGFAVLHAFGTDADVYGAFPATGLIYASDGQLYGLTQGTIGTNATQGTVFRVSTSGDFAPVYLFPGYTPAGPPAPTSALIEGADGGLYGAARGYGALLYRVGKDGSFKTLHTTSSNSILDTNPDGSQYPQQPLLPLPDGSFYGVTSAGGPFGSGSVFKMTADGQVRSLYFFGDSAQGPKSPIGIALGADGALYSSASSGGASNEGALFRLPPPPSGWGTGSAPKVRVSLLPTSVHLSDTSTRAELQWSSPGATACVISGSDGMPETAAAANGSMSLTPVLTGPGVVQYFISCSGSRQGSTVVPLLIEN